MNLDNLTKTAMLMKCAICGAEPGVDCSRTGQMHYLVDRNPTSFVRWEYSVLVDGKVLSVFSGEAAEEMARVNAEKCGGSVVKRPIVSERWQLVE